MQTNNPPRGLSLTRRAGEVIRIGDSIRIVVVKSSRRHVILRIDAPPDVPIHRDEVAEKMTAGVISLARSLRHVDVDQLAATPEAMA